MLNISDINNLSIKYQIPKAEIIFIALNRYGVKYNNVEGRIRFKLKLDSLDEKFFFALASNMGETPFEIIDNILYFNNNKIGNIENIENDTCSETYFRKGKRVMTLNSNSRSTCTGCKFCGTYKLSSEEKEKFDNEDEIRMFLEELLEKNNLKDFSELETVTICTGCFKTENDLVNHIIILDKIFREYNFNGYMRYIGSQIQHKESLDIIKKNMNKFGLLITTEKFVDREKIMREEKARLTLNLSKELMQYGIKLGFECTFLYILGLENLDIFEKYMNYMKESINKLPLVQIFQNYVMLHEKCRCDESLDIEYFLKARKILENIFKDKYMPYNYENYRSLFYTMYNNKEYRCIRI